MKANTRTADALFMAEVIRAESTALSAISHSLRTDAKTAESLSLALDILDGCTGHVVVSGLGKSGLIGAKISATLASLGQP